MPWGKSLYVSVSPPGSRQSSPLQRILLETCCISRLMLWTFHILSTCCHLSCLCFNLPWCLSILSTLPLPSCPRAVLHRAERCLNGEGPRALLVPCEWLQEQDVQGIHKSIKRTGIRLQGLEMLLFRNNLLFLLVFKLIQSIPVSPAKWKKLSITY